MESRELRIGNWVALSGTMPMTIYEIHEDCFYSKDEKGESFKNTWADIKPIPLTEEILLKCGFIKNGKYSYENGLLTYNKSHDIFWIGNKPMNDMKCKYLHQLQNLYFALTGQELEIKL